MIRRPDRLFLLVVVVVDSMMRLLFLIALCCTYAMFCCLYILSTNINIRTVCEYEYTQVWIFA